METSDRDVERQVLAAAIVTTLAPRAKVGRRWRRAEEKRRQYRCACGGCVENWLRGASSLWIDHEIRVSHRSRRRRGAELLERGVELEYVCRLELERVLGGLV